VSRFPAAFPPPAFASWSSCSRRGTGPSSRSADRTQGSGPRRGFHVPHARATTGVGALYIPGTTVLTRTGHDHQPASAASQRHVPAPRHNHHRCEAPLDETSTRVQAIHPSGLPLACDPRMEQEPLGFAPSFAPRDYLQRTSGRGQAIEHGPETTLYVIDLASKPASFTRNVRPRVALVKPEASDSGLGARPRAGSGRHGQPNRRRALLATARRGGRA
jgi:hypothetical protein